MSKSGSYSISKSNKNEAFYKNFLCTFLVYLALLLLLYLMMVALKGGAKSENEKSSNNNGYFDRLKLGEIEKIEPLETSPEITTKMIFTIATKSPTKITEESTLKNTITDPSVSNNVSREELIPATFALSEATEDLSTTTESIDTNLTEKSDATSFTNPSDSFPSTTGEENSTDPSQSTENPSTATGESADASVTKESDAVPSTNPIDSLSSTISQETSTDPSESTEDPSTTAESADASVTKESDTVPSTNPFDSFSSTTLRETSTDPSQSTEDPSTSSTAESADASVTMESDTVPSTNLFDRFSSTTLRETSTDPSQSTEDPSTTAESADASATKESDVVLSTNPLNSFSSTTVQETSTANIPPRRIKPCSDWVCKVTASRVLALMNHREETKPCEDYYEYACDGLQIMKESFFQQNFDSLVGKINNVDEKSEKYMGSFSKFYKSCNDFERDFGIKRRLKFLEMQESKNITNLFIDLVLSQSMPFFGISLNLLDSTTLIFEITVPGSSILKTGLSKWSLMEQVEEMCLEQQTGKITNRSINLDVIVNETKKCIGEKTKDYIVKYVRETKYTDEDSEKGLLNLWNDLQVLLLGINKTHFQVPNDNYCKILTLKNFNEDDTYHINGLNWTAFFEGITRNVQINENIPVKMCFRDYLENVFGIFKKSTYLEEILNLWSKIQWYKNTILDHQSENRETFCMKLATELMPDVATVLIHNLNTDKTKLYAIIETLFKNLKSQFNVSFSTAVTSKDAIELFQKQLQDIDLAGNDLARLIINKSVLIEENYRDVDVYDDSYQKNLKNLLRNYRKTIFSLVDDKVTPEILLKYFVNPFDTKPHTFYPAKSIVFQPGYLHQTSVKLPGYTKLAMKGFALAEQLVYHFMGKSTQSNDPREKVIYDYIHNNNNQPSIAENNLIQEVNYTFGGSAYEIKNNACQGNCLNYDELVVDNAAFRLIADTFKDPSSAKSLQFLHPSFSNEEIFFLLTAQEFCKPEDLEDFVKDFYNGKLPAPIKIRNIMRNSDLFNQIYKCKVTGR